MVRTACDTRRARIASTTRTASHRGTGASPERVGRAWPAWRRWSRIHCSSVDSGDSGGERCQARRPGGAATVAAVALAPTACNSGGGGGSAGVVDDRGGGAVGGIRHGGADAASCGRGVRQIAIEDAEAQHHELAPRSRGSCCMQVRRAAPPCSNDVLACSRARARCTWRDVH